MNTGRSRTALVALFVATALSGLLAGGNLVRLLIETPAWRRVGVMAWAAFSRHADLGNGIVLNPALAIGGALANIVAWLSLRKTAPRNVKAALSVAVGLVIAGLVLTAFAAPQMLSLRSLGDDPVAIQKMFDAVDWWGSLRGVVQIAAFGADLCVLVLF